MQYIFGVNEQLGGTIWTGEETCSVILDGHLASPTLVFVICIWGDNLFSKTLL